MAIESKDNDTGNSFEYKLKEVSDDEIINILRYRDHFQPHAVRSAIKEALHRGIINSVDDLNKNEFQPLTIPPKSFFPISPIDKQNIAIFKSLCRIAYGFGIILLLYSYFQLTRGQYLNGILAILSGIALLFLVFKIERTQKKIFAQIMLFFNFPAAILTLFFIFDNSGKPVMDFIAATIILLVFAYITSYLFKFIVYFNDKK